VTACVYALTAASTATVRTTGLAGEPLRRVTFGAISAIVGELRRPPSPTAANLRRYAETIQRIFADTQAVLPARFGTCVTDADELAFILRSRQASLRAALRQVRNRAQMTLRVVLPASAATPPRAVTRRRPSGADYLHARASEAARAREIPGFEPVRAAVVRWRRDERVEKTGRVATAYHLIPRASADAYRAAVERAAAATGLRVIISGPWPPYAFATF
jgi:hypothetical protein